MNLQPNLMHIEFMDGSTNEMQSWLAYLQCNDDVFSIPSDTATVIDAVLCQDKHPLAIVGLGVLRAGPQTLARMIQERQQSHQVEADRLQALYQAVVSMPMDGWASADTLERQNLLAEATRRRLASEVGEKAEQDYLAGLSLDQLRKIIDAANAKAETEEIPF